MKHDSKVYQSCDCYQATCAVDMDFLCVFKQTTSCHLFMNCSYLSASANCCTSPSSLPAEEVLYYENLPVLEKSEVC